MCRAMSTEKQLCKNSDLLRRKYLQGADFGEEIDTTILPFARGGLENMFY